MDKHPIQRRGSEAILLATSSEEFEVKPLGLKGSKN